MDTELNLYKFISKISSFFIKDYTFDKSINKSLKKLCRITQSHRTYIFTFSKKQTLMNNDYEYCKKGVSSQIDYFQNISTKPIVWWMKTLNEKGVINISDTHIMPKEAAFEQSDLQRQEIRSTLCFAITVKGKIIGFIGIDDIEKPRIWNEKTIHMLKLSSEIVASAFEKNIEKQRVSKLNSILQATLESTKNGIVVIENNGKIINYNQRFLKMWDMNAKQIGIMKDHKLLEHIQQQLINKSTFKEHIEAINENTQEETSYLAMKKNGQIITIYSRAMYIGDTHFGRVYSSNDVTKNKSHEARLKLLSKVFKTSAASIVITNRKNEIVDLNDAFEKTTGYAKEDLIGKNPSILQSKWHNQEFYKSLWKILNKKYFWQGEIWDRRKNGELYLNRLQIHKVENNNETYYISVSQDITKQKEYEEKIEQLAFYDVLTNLPNRSLFNEQLESILLEAQRYERKFALLFLDLDNFKHVNDTFGHITGDKLLQEVAKRLTRNVRISDIVSRLSGDEFTIIIKEIKHNHNLIHTCNKIIKELSAPLDIEEHTIQIGCSIGIAIYPDDTLDKKSLLHHADLAMYNSKNMGKNQYTFYSEHINKESLEDYKYKKYQSV
jgi:diguanylate cyclase (GGDEF)-like protein/PAS domain S-box-containing protein